MNPGDDDSIDKPNILADNEVYFFGLSEFTLMISYFIFPRRNSTKYMFFRFDFIIKPFLITIE